MNLIRRIDDVDLNSRIFEQKKTKEERIYVIEVPFDVLFVLLIDFEFEFDLFGLSDVGEFDFEWILFSWFEALGIFAEIDSMFFGLLLRIEADEWKR